MDKLNLLDPTTTLLVAKLQDEILEIIDHRDDFTRSDLQGAVTAKVIRILNVGFKLAKEG